ncbi:MAG: NfeD family protein [Bacteroidota bacterium]
MELLIPIALILVGLALVAVEVTLVPGTNVVGVLGVIGAATGVVIAFVEGGMVGGMGALVGTVLASAVMGYLLWESGAWNRFVLTDSLRRDADADRVIETSRAALIGRTGVAATPLRPEGVVDLSGERVEARTEGAFVAAGSAVRVVAIDRHRAVVRVEA